MSRSFNTKFQTNSQPIPRRKKIKPKPLFKPTGAWQTIWQFDCPHEDFLKEWQKRINTMVGVIRRSYRLSEEDAADLRQTVSIKLVGIADAKRRHKPLVSTIANNCARDWLRVYLRNEADTDYMEENRLSNRLSSPEASNAQERATSFIATLPELQQKLIRKHYGFDGRPVNKIEALAKSMRMSEEECTEQLQAAIDAMKAAKDAL